MNIDILLAGFDANQLRHLDAFIWLAVGIAALSVAVGIYTFLEMKKMQKKNQPKPNQLDGTIADEGISFYDLAGSPHVHANITDIWDKSTKAIKKKSGGILGIGSSSQVTGYRYYAKFAAFIGNRIEKLIGINFDSRGWIVHDPLEHPPNLLPIEKPSLYGESEGGVAGNVDLEFGYPNQAPNAEYQKYFPLVSGYPYQSYLVFRGLGEVKTSGGLIGGAIGSLQAHRHESFYLGNSGYMKEMLLWVKRTRVRNDGQGQWYATTVERPWVCEIGFFKIYPNGLPINTSMTYWASSFDGVETEHGNYSMNIAYDNTTNGVAIIRKTIYVSNPAKFSFVFASSGTLRAPIITGGEVIKYSAKKSENQYGLFTGEYICALPAGPNEILIYVGFDSEEFVPGTQQPSTKSFSISSAEPSILKQSDFEADSPDINPIHKIREILTDDTAMAKPEADVNDENFMKAADQIWDEGLGISWAIDEKSCIDAIEELCYHIEAEIRVNRQTVLYEMVLFRDDWFAEDEIHNIAESKIKDLSLEVMNSDDIVNQLNVTYYDRERIKNSTFSIYENGSILTMGHANAESVEFSYFMNMRNAEIVANWKLKQFSTPAWSGSFTTGWKEARKWNRYDLIRLPWSSKWNGAILVRIMKINLGSGADNTVTIDFEEVIPYSGEMNTSIVVDETMEEKPLPPQPAVAEVFESPYYFDVLLMGERQVSDELATHPDFGIVFAAALRPQWNSMNAKVLSIAVNKPDDGWVEEGYLEYSSGGVFLEPVIQTQRFIPVGNLKTEYELKPGQLIFVGQWITGRQEFMIFKSYDINTGIMEVERGALDTIPLWWDRVNFFIIDTPFVGDFYYTSTDDVRASVLPTTPSGVLEQLGSSGVEMNSRAIRPYPPANVKINGGYYPETIIVINDIVLTWAGRNRLANQLVDFYDSASDTEANTTYSYELISGNSIVTSEIGVTSNTATIPSSVLMPNKPHTLKLWSVRDEYESHQVFEHSFFVESASLILSASTDGFGVVGNTVPVANISVNIDESLSANMQFDGSSISGKAEPGATITIEVEE